MAKTIKVIGMLDYSDKMEEVMSVEEYIEKATEKKIQGRSEKDTRKHNDRNEVLQRNRLQERGAINDSKEMRYMWNILYAVFSVKS